MTVHEIREYLSNDITTERDRLIRELFAPVPVDVTNVDEATHKLVDELWVRAGFMLALGMVQERFDRLATVEKEEKKFARGG